MIILSFVKNQQYSFKDRLVYRVFWQTRSDYGILNRKNPEFEQIFGIAMVSLIEKSLVEIQF